MLPNLDKFVKKLHILTIATMGDELKCANSFYAYDTLNSALIIAGSSSSEHIKSALKNSKVAGTIFRNTKIVTKIKGLQFEGIFRLANEKEKKIYFSRYPFAKAIKPEIFTIEIEYAKFTNNKLKFAHKEIWKKES
ncbi:MAG: hypothetical protein GXZ15_03455 [Campylobacter sp.]|nr:hypothetical protein [Campylobacter sp.]